MVTYAVLVLLLLAIIRLTNRLLVGQSHDVFMKALKSDQPLKSDQRLSQVASYLNAGLTSVDQVVSMLITVQLGLFVLVGFVVRELAKGPRLTRSQTLWGGVFLASAFASVTLGYAARMQVFKFVDLAYPEFSAIETTVTNQALFVAISAISAVLMVAMFLLDGNRAQTFMSQSLGDAAKAPRVAVAGKQGRHDDAVRESDTGTCDVAHVSDAGAGSGMPEKRISPES